MMHGQVLVKPDPVMFHLLPLLFRQVRPTLAQVLLWCACSGLNHVISRNLQFILIFTTLPAPVVRSSPPPPPPSTSSPRPVPAPAKKAIPQKAAEVDLTIYGPGEGPKSTEKPDPNSPFASLHGMKSMWDIPGLEDNPDITREEYMRIVQDRLKDMKTKRQQMPGFSRTEGEDYLDKLNKKRDHTNQK